MSKRNPPAPRETTATEYVDRLTYVDWLPEVGVLRHDVAALRGKLDRVAELRRQIDDIENDVLRSVQRVNDEVSRLWTADEVADARNCAAKSREVAGK